MAQTAAISLNKREDEINQQLLAIASGMISSSSNGASATIADQLTSSANTDLQGVDNANSAIAYMQIADGALSGVSNGANTLNTLSVAYNNGALNQNDKEALTSQANAIKSSMQTSVDQAVYNGKSVFGDASFFVGSGSINVSIAQPNIASADITNQDSITALQQQVDATRSSVGSSINAAYSSISTNLGTAIAQQSAASQLNDTDMAQAATNFNQAYLQQNATLFATAHSSDYLANQVSRLLG